MVEHITLWTSYLKIFQYPYSENLHYLKNIILDELSLIFQWWNWPTKDNLILLWHTPTNPSPMILGITGAAPGCSLRGGGGGEWQNFLLSTAPVRKKVVQRGGGVTPTHFFSDRNIFCQNSYHNGGGGGGIRHNFFPDRNIFWQNYYRNGVGVLSSSPYVTELTSKKKKAKPWGPPPPPATPWCHACLGIVLNGLIYFIMIF